jgi:tetratricopeptide (TPR) repeat protein
MITIHCTNKLLKVLDLADAKPDAGPVFVTSGPDPQLSGEGAPDSTLGDWYAKHVRIESTEVVAFVNERTLLCVVASLAPIESLLGEFQRRALELLKALRIEDKAAERECAAMREIVFDRAADRSVVASMNRVCQDLSHCVMVNRIKGTTDLVSASELDVARFTYKLLGYLTPELAVEAYFTGDETTIAKLEAARRKPRKTPGHTERKSTRAKKKKPPSPAAIAREHLNWIEFEPREWRLDAPRLDPEVEDDFRIAQELHEVGDLHRADREYREIIRRYPEYIDAHNHLALLQEVRGQHEAAFRRWKLAVEIGFSRLPPGFEFGRDHIPWYVLDNRPFLRAFHSLGLRYFSRGRLRDGIAAFENTIDLNPDDNLGARMLLVGAYFAQGSPMTALELCDRFPDDAGAEILYGRVLALYQLGRLEEAAETLHDAVESRPSIAVEIIAAIHDPPVAEVWDAFDFERLSEAYDYWESYGTFWENTPGAIGFVDDFLAEEEDLETEEEDLPEAPPGETVH